MSANAADQAARLLLDVRGGGSRLAKLPDGLQPATIAQAYAIQDAVNLALGPVAGWKVSPLRGTDPPNCAPIGAALIHASPARLASGALPGAEIEGEVAVTLGRDLPPRATPYGPDDLGAAIASVHLAVEVLSSRFQDRKAVPPLGVVADSQGNAAVVLGPARGDWRDLELGGVAMRLLVGGAEVASVAGGADTANVLASLAWLANHAAARMGGLRRGDVVITGARAGPRPIGLGATTVVADAPDLGRVEIAFD
ncbi:2-keto-4-pentenoate hydratase [Humitalea sp. 24SJ18S-53]|uniref:2-keto-4-pentenoate hydratase n=1 Tax=Humitalea sp. 24SJ18S-53 TaxID=3422307 RepID=UPI003D67F1E8